MNSKKIQNERFDEIERKLLNSVRVRDEQIEEIINSPRLFNLVKAGIAVEKFQSKPKKTFVLPLWNWQKDAFSFGALAVLLIAVFSLSIFLKKNESLPDLKVVINTGEVPVPNPTFDNPTDSTKIERTIFQTKRTNFKKEVRKPKQLTVKTNKRPLRQTNEEEREFYPLTFTEDIEQATEDAQIIRVNLPRSSLIALGVNPPNENAIENIKAELLISSDGVTRGIRFIK